MYAVMICPGYVLWDYPQGNKKVLAVFWVKLRFWISVVEIGVQLKYADSTSKLVIEPV